MRAITHIAAGAAAAAVAQEVLQPSAGLGIFLFSGLLDVDHVPHFVSSGLPARPSALLRSVYSSEEQLESRYPVRRSVPVNVLFPALHCVELVLLLALAGSIMNSAFLTWGAAGMVLHLLMDMGSYPCTPGFFSMTWRVLNRRRLLSAWKKHRSGIDF
ncbi:MAG: hypothetical protein R6U39_06690 [Candidatus Aegiribacteria sp.]